MTQECQRSSTHGAYLTSLSTPLKVKNHWKKKKPCTKRPVKGRPPIPHVGVVAGGIPLGGVPGVPPVGGLLRCDGPGCPAGGFCGPGACSGCVRTTFGFSCGSVSSFTTTFPGGFMTSSSSSSSSQSSFPF
ncbi:hypothetical protein PPACK8108_LOCUS26325 [Phakopsora pachyrhizi]|uniref:Uncharacterized protein n=1 Tax=Phakopsora pachyrhizi TaxID=170000 RepID=A0AAV0BUE6_PHAPC|nr:hypothetical protein PPACK8108_LOCUS26325 [Phakopsora pachyrhizi]